MCTTVDIKCIVFFSKKHNNDITWQLCMSFQNCLFDSLFRITSKETPRVCVMWSWQQCNTWWRHQMEPFSPLLVICAGNSPVPGEFPEQSPVTRTFDVFFDLPLNKPLSKQSWGWWFETLSPPLWRHCNDLLRAPVATLICLYEFSIFRFLRILSWLDISCLYLYSYSS